MTQFDDRERAFEKKFEIDEEAIFRKAAHAAKLFGLWAAGVMEVSGAEAESYAMQVSDLVMAGPAAHDNVLRKVEQDFQAKGLNFTRHRLEKELNDCERKASSPSAA
jgi:hypothetical protein